jgi:ferric-dicitrate binding protein FerR (iron transport regulator)
MGRKRRDQDQLSEDNATPADSAEGAADAEAKPRKRRGRKLVLLAALAGAATYLVRRNQRKAELDEGIWHDAPTASATPSTPTAPTVG